LKSPDPSAATVNTPDSAASDNHKTNPSIGSTLAAECLRVNLIVFNRWFSRPQRLPARQQNRDTIVLIKVQRIDQTELLEDFALPADVVDKAYLDLARTQRLLGNTRAIFRRLAADRGCLCRVLDIGCGQGALLGEIRRKMGVDVIGFDLRPAPSAPVPVVTGNAAVDPLPCADVAISVCLIHHLSEADAIALIRNASKSCRRLILLDLVRHWVPLTLFRVFMAPFLHRINAADGITSIKRAYTPREMRNIADAAMQGTGARIRHSVAPFYIRQIVDIDFRP
jgi:2-polyprenyl-3-methyl-5-hydroxy-6-metoxy-1,4-benzoquinol methylase